MSFERYFEQAFRESRPQKIVVVEGNSLYDEVCNVVGKKYGVPTVCLQQGWAPVIHNGFRDMNYDQFLVWGKGFQDILQPYNPHQKFEVVGSHVIALSNDSLGQTLHPKAITFFVQTVCALISQESYDAFWGLILWTAQTFKQSLIYIRDHPGALFSESQKQQIAQFPNIVLKSPEQTSLTDVLKETQLAVSIGSTTILESIASGIVPLVVSIGSMPRYSPPLEGAGIECFSIPEAQKILALFEQDRHAFLQPFEAASVNFKARYFKGAAQDAISAIVEKLSRV
jgi:hypothetical protein